MSEYLEDFLLKHTVDIDHRSMEQFLVHSHYYTKPIGVEHYQLCAAVSMFFNDAFLFDVGSFKGHSAVALSFNCANRVISYDIKNSLQLHSVPKNVEFRIRDFRNDVADLKPVFIMIDVDPHDGIQEAEFHQFLMDIEYTGYVMWDDIHLNPQMNAFWDQLSLKKIDLTQMGHWSGTGLVKYEN